ncbi:biliverdin-producing heme oxygenase [Zhouia sp. PK063]|uniref:biliverdin-producing heme oxygenase n=1 Tax=Zhouia sp. PK063 TaxID=3373602 RepID=UPI00379F6A26
MILQRLRAETAQQHEETEAENLASKIIDHSISLAEYKVLILQNYVTYMALENVITPVLQEHLLTDESQFLSHEKSEQLALDLKVLHMGSNYPTQELQLPQINNLAQALGALYVIEGSMLGGMMIGEHLPKCEALKEITAFHFFTKDKKEVAERWRNFCSMIRSENLSDKEIEEVIESAKNTFAFFSQVFHKVLATA